MKLWMDLSLWMGLLQKDLQHRQWTTVIIILTVVFFNVSLTRQQNKMPVIQNVQFNTLYTSSGAVSPCGGMSCCFPMENPLDTHYATIFGSLLCRSLFQTQHQMLARSDRNVLLNKIFAVIIFVLQQTDDLSRVYPVSLPVSAGIGSSPIVILSDKWCG